MEAKNIYFKPDEVKFLGLATLHILDTFKANKMMPWSPEARKCQKEIEEAGNRVKLKLQKLGLDMSEMPDLFPGEENDWLTKES